MKLAKRFMACALAASLALGTATVSGAATSPTTSVVAVTEDDVLTNNGSTIDTNADGTATLTSAKKISGTTYRIQRAMTVNGVTYKITAIGANALSSSKQVKKVVVPKSVRTIKKKAFSGLKNLKKVVLVGNKYTKVAKGAFKGLKTKKITIKLSSKMSKKAFKKMKKQLKKAGFKGKVTK